MEKNDNENHAGKILIMGIGNLLLGDEGVGVHAAQALLKMELPKEVETLDVGTAFLDALPALEKAERIIVIDALQARGKPGTVYKIFLDQCERIERIDSMHGFDIFRMLEISQNKKPTRVTVLGVEPAHIGWSMELSPQVADSMSYLLDAVKKEISHDVRESPDNIG